MQDVATQGRGEATIPRWQTLGGEGRRPAQHDAASFLSTKGIC